MKTLKTAELLRAKAMTAYADALGNYGYLCGTSKLDQESLDAITAQLPQFFYFSAYEILPGECDLTDLAAKMSNNGELSSNECTVTALLAHAGVHPSDFMDSDYDSRKAELQAASVDLSQSVFEYWTQNTDLDFCIFGLSRASLGERG